MNIEKVIFAFFILLAGTLNFGFVWGSAVDSGNPHMWDLFAATIVSLIATVLKFGDRTQVGAVHLASSLVALLQLTAALLVWFFASNQTGASPGPAALGEISSLAAGALFANIASVVIMIADTTVQRR
jgi:hypothetical protein